MDILQQVVDDVVVAHVHLLLLGQGQGLGVGPDIEAHHDGVRGRGQHDVALGDLAETGMDDGDLDVLGPQLGQGLGQGLDGAVHVGLEHHLELLDRAVSHLLVELFQGYPADAGQGGFPLLLLAHHGDLLGLALIFQHQEFVPGLGDAVEPLDFHRQPRRHLIHFFAPVVEQGPHPAVLRAAHKVIPGFQGAFLDQHGAHRTPAFVQPGFDDPAAGRGIRHGLEIQDFRLEEDLLQQFLDADAFLGRHLGKEDVAAPFFRRPRRRWTVPASPAPGWHWVCRSC